MLNSAVNPELLNLNELIGPNNCDIIKEWKVVPAYDSIKVLNTSHGWSMVGIRGDKNIECFGNCSYQH